MHEQKGLENFSNNTEAKLAKLRDSIRKLADSTEATFASIERSAPAKQLNTLLVLRASIGNLMEEVNSTISTLNEEATPPEQLRILAERFRSKAKDLLLYAADREHETVSALAKHFEKTTRMSKTDFFNGIGKMLPEIGQGKVIVLTNDGIPSIIIKLNSDNEAAIVIKRRDLQRDRRKWMNALQNGALLAIENTEVILRQLNYMEQKALSLPYSEPAA